MQVAIREGHFGSHHFFAWVKTNVVLSLWGFSQGVYSNFLSNWCYTRSQAIACAVGGVAGEPLQNAFEALFLPIIALQQSMNVVFGYVLSQSVSEPRERDARARTLILIYKFQRRGVLHFFKKRLVFRSSLSPPRSQALQNYGHAWVVCAPAFHII
jgi:hypothetical protein